MLHWRLSNDAENSPLITAINNILKYIQIEYKTVLLICNLTVLLFFFFIK